MQKNVFQPEEGYVIPENGIEVVNEGETVGITFDIVEREVEEGEPKQYEGNFVRLKHADMEYGKLVSAIVNAKYDNDAMQAIINNHLVGGSEEHEEQFVNMQDWRNHAKEVAHEILG